MPDLKSQLQAGRFAVPAASQPQESNQEIQFRPDRVGRATYNFVPPPKRVKYVEAPEPLHDKFSTDHLSGFIDLTIEAKTPFYVRGMWPLREFESGKEVRDQPRPFEVGKNCLRLPGSSIRGMLRTIVEILVEAPLDPINGGMRMFYRSVGTSNNPQDPSYDANCVDYKKRIWKGDGTRNNPAEPIVKAGFLSTCGREWKIFPARQGLHGNQYYRYEMKGAIRQKLPQKIWFEPARAATRTYPHSRVFANFALVTKQKSREDPKPAEMEPGYLIQSGDIKGKYMQWIMHEVDSQSVPVKVPVFDKEAFLEDKASKGKFAIGKQEQPCFYTEWLDTKGNTHVSFGHTPYFRLPYVSTPGEVNPAIRKSAQWDMAQAIFGRANNNNSTGATSRISVEDAVLPNPDEVRISEIICTFLGTPKPTIYQHYLTQNTTERGGAIHWDHQNAKLRGHKRFWVRKGATLPKPQNENPDAPKLQPVSAGPIFSARIRYDNLSQAELGALLAAIELGEGSCHQMGMAKGHGMGCFEIRLQLSEISRTNRYKSFFSGSALNTGVALADSRRVWELKDAFAKEMGSNSLDDLWSSPRLQELRALVTSERPNGLTDEQWHNATRHLEFGRLSGADRQRGEDLNFNEYIKCYYQQSDGTYRSENSRRRPLPPATVVRRADPKEIPTNASPRTQGPTQQSSEPGRDHGEQNRQSRQGRRPHRPGHT